MGQDNKEESMEDRVKFSTENGEKKWVGNETEAEEDENGVQ